MLDGLTGRYLHEQVSNLPEEYIKAGWDGQR